MKNLAGKETEFLERHGLWFVLVCVWVRLGALYMHNPFFGEYDSNFPYCLLSYRLYFCPRAVVGTVYDALSTLFGVSWKGFCILRFAFVFTAYTAVAAGVWRMLRRLESRETALLLGFLAFTLPSTFHPANIITMFDVFIVTAMAASIGLIRRDSAAWFMPVPALVALAVLTHENFIFMYLPFLLGVLLWCGALGNMRGRAKLAAVFGAAAIAFCAMAYYRSRLHTEPGLLDGLNAELIRRAQAHGYEAENCLVTLELTYWEHIKSVWSHFFLEQFGPYQIAVNVISAVLLIPAGMVLHRLWRHAWQTVPRELRPRLLCLLVSCFGAAGLFIVAHDYIRWFSAILICNTAALLMVYADCGLKLALTPAKKLCWLYIGLFYICLEPPSGICFSLADLLAYPIFKLCL